MIEAIRANPIVAGVLLPLVAAIVLALVIGAAGRGPASRYAIGGAFIGFLLAYLAIEALPDLPPSTAKQKVFYLVILAFVAGLTLDRAGRPRLWQRAILLLYPVVALVWLAWRPLQAGPDARLIAELAVLWGVSAIILLRLAAASSDGALRPGPLVVVAAVGAAVIGLVGASASLAQLSAAIAAALGGMLLVAFIARLLGRETPYDFGATGILGVGASLLTLVYVMVLFAPDVSRPALGVLLLVFVADLMPHRFARLHGALRRAAGPVILTLLAAVPTVVAIAVALLTLEESPY